MIAEDQNMLDFARIWAPYGGAPSDEILIHFGMSPTRFYQEVSRVLRTPRARLLSKADRTPIENIAARLSLPQSA